MTEQTEQEPIDPIAQCIRWLSFMVVNQEDRRMVQAELESIAAQVRERDAQIARLSAELVEQRVIGHGEGQQHTIDDVNAGRIDPLIAPRLDTLRAERDAAQQAHSELASLVGAALVYATLDSEAGEKPTAEPDHALTETVWKLVQQRGRMESALATVRDCIIALTPGHRTGYDWNTDPLYLTRKEGQALAAIDAALSSSPRPQEPQPAEPKSAKPVVNLMEALKKSLDSLNANRTSQEPGGHQP